MNSTISRYVLLEKSKKLNDQVQKGYIVKHST